MACLRRFAREGSQAAFATVVRRRIDMVYSAALRQVRDPAAAEDVTQGVFITLARKAAGLIDRDIVLSAWLLQATHLAALDALRRERRRQRHEQRAATMKADQTAPPPDDDGNWDDVRPVLDAAMSGLRENDRRAIALRFFEGRSIREIGLLQGISEEAARQRLWRAMERLREKLGARGVTPSAVGLASLLTAHVVQAAPASLADAATRAALAAAATKAAIPIGLKGAIHLMAWTKAQTVGAAVLATLLIGGTAATVVYVNRTPVARQVVLAPGTPRPVSTVAPLPLRNGSTTPIQTDARTRFNQAYALEPGRAMKHVQPPFIPERAAYLHSIDNLNMFDVAQTAQLYAFTWDGREASFTQWSASPDHLGLVIHDLLGVPRYKLEMAPADYNRPLPGDWVFRPGATLEEKFAELSRILAQEQHVGLRFEKPEGVRPVLVATGQLHYTPLNPKEAGAKDRMVHFYVGKPPRQTNGMAIGDRAGLFQAVGEALGREVIDETTRAASPATQPAPDDRRANTFLWSNHLPGRLTPEQRQEAADNIGRQLGLTFTPDERAVSYWAAVPVPESASTR